MKQRGDGRGEEIGETEENERIEFIGEVFINNQRKKEIRVQLFLLFFSFKVSTIFS